MTDAPDIPIPEFQFTPVVNPPGSVPFLAPGTQVAVPGSAEWLRAPDCPNTAQDCRISVTRQAVQNPIPPAIVSGDGQPHPPLYVQSLPRGACSVCGLTWNITKGPLGPNEVPFVPVTPPTFPPVVP
jgi:hypothetical protein